MATIILTQRALASESDLAANRVHLSDEEKLIHSMRGVTSNVARLIAEWHVWLAAASAYPEVQDGDDYIQIVKSWTMKESMLDLILIRLRQLFEQDKRVLSTNQIAKLLPKQHLQEFLRERSRKQLGESGFDEKVFDGHIYRIFTLCSIHYGGANEVPHASLKRIRSQTRLAVRAANLRAAHTTLDNYSIHVDDLHDLIQHALTIAKSIHAILGRDAGPFDYDEVDRAAFEASRQIFGVDHGAGLLAEIGKRAPIPNGEQAER